MAAKITTKITENNIEKVLAEIEARMDAALDEAGEQAVALAKRLAPVDTGFMRDSIILVNSGEQSRTIRSMARYSYFIEYGTKTKAPRPFIAPALFLYSQLIKQKFSK